MGEPAGSVTRAKNPPTVYRAPSSRGMTLPCNPDNAKYVPVYLRGMHGSALPYVTNLDVHSLVTEIRLVYYPIKSGPNDAH